MDSQTTDITHFVNIFHSAVTIKALEPYKTQLLAYDITTENFANLHDVYSLTCKIKILNGCVPGTLKWTIVTSH